MPSINDFERRSHGDIIPINGTWTAFKNYIIQCLVFPSLPIRYRGKEKRKETKNSEKESRYICAGCVWGYLCWFSAMIVDCLFRQTGGLYNGTTSFKTPQVLSSLFHYELRTVVKGIKDLVADFSQQGVGWVSLIRHRFELRLNAVQTDFTHRFGLRSFVVLGYRCISS